MQNSCRPDRRRRPRSLLKHVFPTDKAPLAGHETCQLQLSDSCPDQPKRRKTDSRRHTPNLTVLAFGQRQADPGIGNRFSKPNRRHAGRKDRGIDRFGSAGLCPELFQENASAKGFQSFRRRHTFHLGQICARMSERRIQQFSDQPPVVRQQKKPLAVVIKPPGRINIRRKTERFKTFMTPFGRKLAENAVGFMKRNILKHDAVCL